ncbi:MAG TPA: enoyl-CoA hydratase [Hyphomicrobiaceae bacterium]
MSDSPSGNRRGSPGSDLQYAVEGEVGIVTFNRPAAHNALTFEMYEQLGQICAAVTGSGPVKALIVTGAGGRAFGAGTDIALFRDFRSAEDGLAYEARMEAMFDRLERCPVPTIAAIPGICTGGAAVIAAACDLRLATRNLRYGFPIARTLANCLSAANIARVALLTGVARAMDMLLTTRLIEADEALAIGLVSELLDTPDALMARARALAGRMAAQAPLTMRAGKEVVRRMRGRLAVEDKDLIALCYGSADFREGLDAFLAKRKPQFTGR